MAITRRSATGVTDLYGLSGDTKPTTFGVGTIFYEEDTGDTYRYSGSAWFKADLDNPVGGGGGAGDASAANQTTLNTLTGAVTETAPATDTASSGLNGRLQRIAQRITSLIALLPAALGAGGGLKVDGSGTALPVSGTVTVNAIPAGTNNIGDVDVLSIAAGDNNIGNVDIVSLPALPAGTNNIGDIDVLTMPTAATPTQSSVAGSATSVTLLAAAATRRGATIVNDSAAILYVRLGSAAASTANYTAKLVTDAYYEVPYTYVGAITGIWASATGNARITELTP